ncbi:transferrin receptor-like dimerization domain-containing protein [Rhodanobacter sp. T12-5]|uniref:transferrin receptor-like dimerization domain-containing protein n=1 Tax=Rhodanobacter sp. T12-5 TaxID=2024611 RepID=UPI0011EF32A6|nr:transferrin receptor-like dimerization domain-containing protein [Rhodanobacter sp. T12-5]KAA0068628.1 folate hydrolase [Rhodanobacter sp. T12-5]
MIRMTTKPLLLVACLVTALGAASTANGDQSAGNMLGFSANTAASQQKLEESFDAQLQASDIKSWLKSMSSEPNQVGSPHDKANAEFVLAKFKEFGWDARIETFSVLYPTPKKVQLQLIAPTHYDAVLREPPIPGDPSTDITKNVLPPYNAYGGDGDVTGELVYANYGLPDDYAELARHGIDVRGKIVITRYGGGWRGLKPELAQEHGAIGCLIYSDPHEDGYFKGDVYPKGSWRPDQGVQRGSVAKMQVHPGDPLTPNIGSTKDAKRLAIKDAKTILKIPVLPISYGDATPLLEALGGPIAPDSWRGSLPMAYHMGSGPAKVHMVVESDWDQKTIYDVIAKLKGSTMPDQWIIRGNHRDGWVFGTEDPLSSHVAMLEEAKVLGAMYKKGWRPQRTIVYGSWDGEEPGLLGSTEWVETHAKELSQKAVLYINTDGTSRGFLGAGGSHSLQHLVNQVAADVTDPETNVSVEKRLRAHLMTTGHEGGSAEAKAQAKAAASGGDLPIEALGSGSDFTPFLQHLGIASLNVGFGGEGGGGVYHSAYDTFDHYARFSDPKFEYGVTLAKVVGRLVMRMADADVLPMRFSDFSAKLTEYMGELHQLVAKTRAATEQQHRLLDSDAFKLAADPLDPVAPPVRESDMPQIDLKPLDESIKKLARSMQAYDAAYKKVQDAGYRMPKGQERQLNELIGRMEASLTDPAGLPGRTWFKHMVYAPGMLTGYGVKTLPGVREALEARRWNEANEYAGVTAKVIDGYRAQIEKATALLNKS